MIKAKNRKKTISARKYFGQKNSFSFRNLVNTRSSGPTRQWVYFLIILLLSACGPKVELKNFDHDAWISDPNGCKGDRLTQVEVIRSNLELFKGLNQNEVTDILGKADKNELYKRSQKFFVYHIGPAPDCEQNDTTSSTYLSIRFNAMGLAKEVLIYED